MICLIRRRPLITTLVLVPLLCALQRPASAIYEIETVSKARAKELGITVHPQPRPDSGDVWVHVEFKATGALKGFQSADLDVHQGGKRLLSTALMLRKAVGNDKPDTVRVDFYIEPALLSEATVTILTRTGQRGGVGYQLQMRDYPPTPAR